VSHADVFFRWRDRSQGGVGASRAIRVGSRAEWEVEQAVEVSASFTRAILFAKYYADIDRIELVTRWCTLIVDRQKIEELRLCVKLVETISVSFVGEFFLGLPTTQSDRSLA
jgi:hypothetical protein